MRETQFIKQNKQKWKDFEKVLKQKEKDPDQLSELFVQITDDLAYARTYYPNRSVRYYLNNIAQKIFYNVYKNRRISWKGFLLFWKEELPSILYQSRLQLLFSFLAFCVAILIGVVSSVNDEAFYNVILGESYVRMTVENIESGDPMAVYKGMNETEMFLGITFNNIRVAFVTFLFGLLAGIGSVFVLFYNGIMVGSFQYFFYEQGLFQESFLTIWMHGALEIPAIIIAGAAGIVMGSGLAFPGTYSRLQAFQISSGRGLKILLGTTPIIIVAGFIEGFITRHTEAPDGLRLVVILGSLAFILLYFVWYPYQKAKSGSFDKIIPQKLPPTKSSKITFKNVKNNGQILSDIFLVYQKHFKTFLIAALSLALLTSIAETVRTLSSENFNGAIFYDSNFFASLGVFFDYEMSKVLLVCNTAGFTIVSFIALHLMQIHASQLISRPLGARLQLLKDLKDKLWQVALAFSIFMISLYLLPIPLLQILLLLPLFLFGLYITFFERKWIGTSTRRTFKILRGNWIRFGGLVLIIGFISLIYLLLAVSPLTWFYFEIIHANLDFSYEQNLQLSYSFSIFVITASIYLALPLLVFSLAMLYHTLIEVQEARNLRKKLAQINSSKRK